MRRLKKLWAAVHARPDGSLVAFEDLFDMVQAIIACEVDKYEREGRSPQEAWRRWGAMVQEILVLSSQRSADWDVLANRFGLPRRDGSRSGPVLVLSEERGENGLPWPASRGQNIDGTWGETGWFTEALYREWG